MLRCVDDMDDVDGIDDRVDVRYWGYSCLLLKDTTNTASHIDKKGSLGKEWINESW